MEEATLGGGCFWCIEAVVQRLNGVQEVVPGYAGGHVEDPTYRQVCSGTTGHAEVVRVRFDPDVLPFRALLEVFFSVHDPTTPNRQGPDVGPQYRSIILYHDAAQEETARATIREMEEQGLWDDPVVTEVEPLRAFHPAEESHHDYYRKNPGQGYCRVVIAPKLAELRKRHAHRLRPEA